MCLYTLICMYTAGVTCDTNIRCILDRLHGDKPIRKYINTAPPSEGIRAYTHVKQIWPTCSINPFAFARRL